VIDKEEIITEASNLNLQPTTIEKDYVLSWMLAGINEHPLLSEILIFKGGTCLKKCFFAKYRFSEDLDFVLIDKSYLKEEFFFQAFNEVCSWVREDWRSGTSMLQSNLDHLAHSPLTNSVSEHKMLYERTSLSRVGFRGRKPTRRRDSPFQDNVFLTPREVLLHHRQLFPESF